MIKLSLLRTSWAIAGVAALLSLACSQKPPDPRIVKNIESVELREVVENAQRYNGSRIRVNGVCRIEFEGNALYLDGEDFRERRTHQAVWLDLGWPVRLGSKDLDGKVVTIEATFDAMNTGTERAFAGSLIDIASIEAVP